MKKILLLALLTCSMSFAQNQVALQVTQDAKLAVVGDKEHNYDAGTLDVSIKVLLEGRDDNTGFIIVYPEFEYADLRIEAYRRWSGNVGYMFSNLTENQRLQIGASIGFGFIDRGLSDFSWGTNGFLQYKISDTFKAVSHLQLIERSDLDTLYGDKNQWRLSGFIGIQVKVFEPKGRRFNKSPMKEYQTIVDE